MKIHQSQKLSASIDHFSYGVTRDKPIKLATCHDTTAVSLKAHS